MIERIRKKYAMTEKGAKDYVAAVFWSVLVNISKMLPVGVLATALSGIVEALTNGTDPRAGLTRFLVAGVLALAALFVTFLIQYKALYEATYRESANRRIRLAEVLRQLPLSFFGNRDLTDLTTTIMGDTETLEKAFSHFYPAMHGALISTALISAGMLLYDWRMALALLWVVPASLLMVYLSRRMEKRHITKGLVTRRAATDAMQEVLECAPEIKACNQKARYIADLNRRLDEAEQDTIRGELFTGSVVTAAQSFLKLGIATTVLTGVTLMSRGDLALIPFLMFLIAATRVYDPIGSMFANMAAVFACEVRIERMQEIENEKRMTGMTEYDPDGYDIRFEHVTFAYREKEDVLRDVSFTAKQGQVTALVELKARFDEARNLEKAEELQRSGVQVVYGVKGLKTHAKICLVVRREQGMLRRYCHFGTGNYNETTAKIYTDISYLTCDDQLGADASQFFNSVTGRTKLMRFRKLYPSPVLMKARLIELIEGEAERARQGEPARISAKMNSLQDVEIIDALYRAADAGVDIELNVRGICCLKTGPRPNGKVIRVVSIVDRYLEHARIFFFHHGGNHQLFIASADWMTRNLDKRVELMVPVTNGKLARRLKSILDACFRDNVQACNILPDGTSEHVVRKKGQKAFRLQQYLTKEARRLAKDKERERQQMLEPHTPH